MQLNIVTATGKRQRVDVEQEELTASSLQVAVLRCLGLPPYVNLRLVCGGRPLADDEAVSKLKDGGA